jgi:hypothetical protein
MPDEPDLLAEVAAVVAEVFGPEAAAELRQWVREDRAED